MDVSKQTDEIGEKLIEKIASLTELPEALIQNELNNIVQAAGFETKSVTLEDLRNALLNYLQTMQPHFPAEESTIIPDSCPVIEPFSLK